MLNWLFGKPKHWVMRRNGGGELYIVMSRIMPSSQLAYDNIGSVVQDGPFDTAKEAGDALTFWKEKYE